MSFFGKDKPKTTQVSTLTPEQQQYLSWLMPQAKQAYGQGLAGMTAGMQESSYKALSPGYFQEAVANPYMQKRQEAWQDIQSNMAGRGAGMHSSAMTKIKGKYDLETQGQLQQQQQNFLLQERGLEMQGMESLFGRQLQGGSALMGQGMAPMGVKAFENMAYQEKSLAEKLGMGMALGQQGISLGKDVYKLFGGGASTGGASTGGA